MKRFILAITGASGACYAKRLFDVLKEHSELHVVISERGVELIKLELNLKTLDGGVFINLNLTQSMMQQKG